jgi:hypothetical protein
MQADAVIHRLFTLLARLCFYSDFNKATPRSRRRFKRIAIAFGCVLALVLGVLAMELVFLWSLTTICAAASLVVARLICP